MFLPLHPAIAQAAAPESVVEGADNVDGFALPTELPSQERLLHRKPAGEYIVTILGERLIGDAYFVFDIEHPEGTVGPDSRVTVTLYPDEFREGEPSSEVPELEKEVADAGTEPPPAPAEADGIRYEARFDSEQAHFVIDDLVFNAKVSVYRVVTRIEGALGPGEKNFYLDIYPLKTEAGLGFRLLNLVLPPLLLVGVLLFVKRAKWQLVRPTRAL